MPSEKTNALLKQVPGPDNQSLKNPQDAEAFNKVVDQLLAGGAESVADLVALLRPRSDTNEENAKARFVLHAMVIRAGDPQNGGAARQKLAGALAATLASDQNPEVAAFVVRELQLCGDEEQAAAVGRFLTHENVELANTAAQALVVFGAAEPFRAALPKVQGENRLIAIQGLGELADKHSAATIREALNDNDQGIRLAACAALAGIGDAASAEALVAAAKKENGLARAQAVDACLHLAEKLEAAGNKSAADKIRSQIK